MREMDCDVHRSENVTQGIVASPQLPDDAAEVIVLNRIGVVL